MRNPQIKKLTGSASGPVNSEIIFYSIFSPALNSPTHTKVLKYPQSGKSLFPCQHLDAISQDKSINACSTSTEVILTCDSYKSNTGKSV